MKTLCLVSFMLVLSGCGMLEHPEKAAKDAKICQEAGLKVAMNSFGKVICKVKE